MATPPYTFTQTLNDLAVSIPLDRKVKGSDLVVKLEKDAISSYYFRYKNSDSFIVNGQLHKSIKPKDSTWTLENGTILSLELIKFAKSEWWACVCKGDPEIDTTKIEPENSKLSDLEGETKTMVAKMMFDQQQKAMGKPTSDELHKQETLQKFMQQHPEMDFKATDPSIDVRCSDAREARDDSTLSEILKCLDDTSYWSRDEQTHKGTIIQVTMEVQVIPIEMVMEENTTIVNSGSGAFYSAPKSSGGGQTYYPSNSSSSGKGGNK